jgi:hypothetical protein
MKKVKKQKPIKIDKVKVLKPKLIKVDNELESRRQSYRMKIGYYENY